MTADASKVGDLRRLAEKMPHFTDWVAQLESADEDILLHLIPELHTGQRGDRIEAYRDSARMMLQSKLTDRLTTKMGQLDKAASKLSLVGIVVAIVIGIATILVTVL